MKPAWNIHSCRCGHGKAIHLPPSWKLSKKRPCRFPECKCKGYTRKKAVLLATSAVQNCRSDSADAQNLAEG